MLLYATGVNNAYIPATLSSYLFLFQFDEDGNPLDFVGKGTQD